MLFLTLLAAGQGLASPSLASLLSRESADDEQGSTLGVGQAFSAAARAAGPLVAGWLFDLGAGVALPGRGAADPWRRLVVSRVPASRVLPVPQDTLAG